MAPSNRNCYNSSESVSDPDVSAVEEVHYIGVRERQPGRYISEIRDPSTKSKRRWLGTFNSSEEAARAYDNAARAMRGAKAKTNFPAPSLQLDSTHNQSCTTATTTLHSAPQLNKNMTSARSAFGSQVKPWAYVNELEVGMGGGVGYHSTIAPTKTLMGVSLSEENVGFQIQKGPHPMGVSLSEENVGFLIQKEHPGLGVRPVNNVLPAAETSIFCDLSSSSGVVDSVSPPKKKNTMTRSFDLNLPVPLEDDDDDEREPSLSLSLGFDFPKNSWVR